MIQDLTTLQKHLTLAREHARNLKIEKRELLVEHYVAKERLDKTKRRYRIALTVSAIISLWIGYTNMRYAADVRWSANKLRETKDLQQRFDNILSMLHYQNARVLELEEANNQLTSHCKPQSIIKAIKATPLPPLVLS